MPNIIFHTGKGGVGKSTLSALTAVASAEAGRETLLVSLDPAHNLADILGVQLGDDPRTVAPRLRAREIDAHAWLHRYLRELELDMRRSYTYLTALNLDRHFRLLRHSPGMEEFALSLAFRDLERRHGDSELIVCDMPPTALALRFFAAPSVALTWTEELTQLRRVMLEKKQIATKIRFGSAEFESDRVLRKLEEERLVQQRQQHLFRDRERTQVRIVANGDTLSLREAERINQELLQLGIHPALLLLNRCAGRPAMPAGIAPLPSHIIPASADALTGLPELRRASASLHALLP